MPRKWRTDCDVESAIATDQVVEVKRGSHKLNNRNELRNSHLLLEYLFSELNFFFI